VIETLVRRAKATVVLGVLALVVLAVANWYPDGEDEARPSWGPSEPNWEDPNRRCTNLVLLIEITVGRHDVRESARINYEATLGSAGISGGSKVRMWDQHKHPERSPWRKEFCAKRGDWLHADVTLDKGEEPVSDIACSFSKGPRFERDDITSLRADPTGPEMWQTWCEATAP
jgi:hypothetical protein